MVIGATALTATLTTFSRALIPLYVSALAYCVLAATGIGIIRWWYGSPTAVFGKPESPRALEVELDAERDRNSLTLSGASVALQTRQYSYQGEMQRSIAGIRRSSGHYRVVNNAFQSVIILGSLAMTAVSSLNDGGGVLKWSSVGLSFTVGAAAGFLGYFKYRERAFYLQQTADDIEEQMNAYRLGLHPYDKGTEEERIGLLTKQVEVIRVAQQLREQQLDQPRTGKEEN